MCVGCAAGVHWAYVPPACAFKETVMSNTPQRRRFWRKLWGAVCVLAGLISIAAGLESVLLE